MSIEIDNIKLLTKTLISNKLLCFYIYDDNIDTSNIYNLINRENYNQNINIFKINSKNKELLTYLDITTFPIIKLYKNTKNTEIFINNKHIKEILNKIFNY